MSKQPGCFPITTYCIFRMVPVIHLYFLSLNNWLWQNLSGKTRRPVEHNQKFVEQDKSSRNDERSWTMKKKSSNDSTKNLHLSSTSVKPKREIVNSYRKKKNNERGWERIIQFIKILSNPGKGKSLKKNGRDSRQIY